MNPKFNIYPNPSNSVINIELPKNENIEICKVYSTPGELLKTVTVMKNDAVSIDVSAFKNGLYFLEFMDSTNRLFRYKFIING